MTNLANFASLSLISLTSLKSFKSVGRLFWYTLLLYWMSESSLSYSIQFFFELLLFNLVNSPCYPWGPFKCYVIMFLTFLGPPTSLMIYTTVNHQKLPISNPTHPPLWWRNTWMVPCGKNDFFREFTRKFVSFDLVPN